MPGTVQGLKDRLLRAIDDTGNVLDMGLLAQVISELEVIPVTAEELTVTRLGRFINNARRKTSDKDLARRMKNLLKEWQLLVQKSVEKNGIVSNIDSDNSTSHLSTPPPSVPITTATTISSIGSGEKKPNNPLSNRKLLLSKFSAIKQASTPQATPTTLSLTSSSASTYSSLIAPPNNVTKLSLSSLTTPTPISNGTKSIESLTVRFPLERLPREQDVSSLVVSISLALISFPSRQSLIEPPFQPEVNITSPLIVQIKRSLLNTPRNISPVHFPLPSKPISSLLPNTVNETVNYTHTLPGAPSGRLKSDNIPEFCTAGIDGCLSVDGMWYHWTDVIPHNEPVVTILPYVYIDGLELSDYSSGLV